MLSGEDQDWINLTLKTYNSSNGLATRIHNAQVVEQKSLNFNPKDMFYIKGPMGRGLQIQENGLHVGFCAGTGALIFLDLVAHLLIVNIFNFQGKSLPIEMQFYQPGFKLHLYISFQSRASAIGLDLIEALEKINEKLGFDNFKATVRLSETDSPNDPKLPHWTPEYIERQLAGYAGQLKKIWVCGPPALNELFDKALDGLLDKLEILKHQVDIM